MRVSTAAWAASLLPIGNAIAGLSPAAGVLETGFRTLRLESPVPALAMAQSKEGEPSTEAANAVAAYGLAQADLKHARRMSQRELEAFLPGRRFNYEVEPAGGTYRSIYAETFHRGANRREVDQDRGYGSYSIQYASYKSGGRYRIHNGQLCTSEVGNSVEHCRRLYISRAGRYFISTFENKSVPSIIINTSKVE